MGYRWQMRVRCVKLVDALGNIASTSSWAKVGAEYEVLGASCDGARVLLRLIGEEAIPALFELEMFEVVNPSIPPSWIVAVPRPGLLTIGPEAWARPGFWEAFFDQEPWAQACFQEELQRLKAS
jgi:hypothetical protein